jgi:superfamily II DNA helicase RecQ
VATVAVGLGLDSPNVRHIIHWGPPEDLELYVPESRWGGRDGKQSTATLVAPAIIPSFIDPRGTVRIVVATVAVGLGLDSPNVRHIIHWGPPEDLELYVPESRWGGRDGKQSTATLVTIRGSPCLVSKRV